MARASGDASDGLMPGSFFHQPSGVEYRLFLKDNQAWLSYERPEGQGADELDGEHRLTYYIGSGNRGRTYLFSQDGFWFESPVNWYTRQQLWDMNPKSMNAKQMPFTLPVDSTCLHCHTTGAAQSLPGSRNHFPGLPFQAAGITCAACHGDPSEHLAQNGRGPILNPASLTGPRRDSICLQCHLEGEIAVNQPGRTLNDFQPGDDLAEDVRFFVHQGEIGSGGRAASQWEALLQSACYRKSGGKMSCTTCHDPHSDPAPEERVAFFRAKCLACHGNPQFVAQHHPDQSDCSHCHMARENTSNIAHEQVTDHFIRKRPSIGSTQETVQTDQLVAVGNEAVTIRDLGFAYTQLLIDGDTNAAPEAADRLREAERQEEKTGKAAHDAELHAKLGYVDLVTNDLSGAIREYQLALAIDPAQSVAAADLAVLLAQQHHLNTALPLWRTVVEEDPSQTGAGYDLALAECMTGDQAAANQALQRVLAFSPDNQKAKSMLLQLQHLPGLCAVQSTRHHR